MTTIDGPRFDPTVLGEEALRRLTEYDKLMAEPKSCAGSEFLTYHRVALGGGEEVPADTAIRYANHFSRAVDQLARLARAAAVADPSRPTVDDAVAHNTQTARGEGSGGLHYFPAVGGGRL